MGNDIRAVFHIALKDMKTYYLKPPAVSWGIVFPMAWILAFYLRNPRSFEELVPGLIAMTMLFSTTAAEAVVINFELRIGSLERLLLAPVSLPAVLLGKVLGGSFFGLIMTAAMVVFSVAAIKVQVNFLYLTAIILPSLLAFSSLGALLCVMVKEVFEAQTLLNLPRFLMIFISGVVIPVSSLPVALQYLSRVMPLTYTVDGLRQAFLLSSNQTAGQDALILAGFFMVFIIPSIKLLSKRFE